jgi:hypothetical protein
MRMARRILGTLLALGLVGAPATAEDEVFVPNLRTEQVWFHCEGDTKVHDSVSNGAIGWDTTAPTQSVTAGAGCGSVDNPVHGNNQVSVQDAHFGGFYDGNLDTMTVELHNIYVGAARAQGPLTFNIRLAVDGTPILGEAGKDVSVSPVRSATGASEMVKFTIAGIGLTDALNNLEHDVLMTVTGGAPANDAAVPIRDTASGWVYDSTEVPAGIVFNPATPESVVVTP